MPNVTLDQATTLIDAALAAGVDARMMPLTVAVLDTGGHLVALKRQDGSGIMRVRVATGKAWGALGMGASSRLLRDRLSDRPGDGPGDGRPHGAAPPERPSAGDPDVSVAIAGRPGSGVRSQVRAVSRRAPSSSPRPP